MYEYSYVRTLSVVYFVSNYVHVFFLFSFFLFATFDGEIKISINKQNRAGSSIATQGGGSLHSVKNRGINVCIFHYMYTFYSLPSQTHTDTHKVQ